MTPSGIEPAAFRLTTTTTNTIYNVRDFNLPLQCKWALIASGILLTLRDSLSVPPSRVKL